MRTFLATILLFGMCSVAAAVEVPYGFYSFCRVYIASVSCAARPPGPPLPLTPQLLATLDTVNRLVSQTVREETDLVLYQTTEHWAIPSTAGDCEDIALLKQILLVERSVPAHALLLGYVLDAHGEGHMVLLVHTNQGLLVLDNKSTDIVPVCKTSYVLKSRQSVPNPLEWVPFQEGYCVAAQ